MDEIKRLCLEQLEMLSEKKLLKILEGMNETFRHHCTQRIRKTKVVCL